MKINLLFKSVFLFCLAIFASGCAGTYASKFAYNDSYKINSPVKAEGCYDASVLLGVDAKRSQDIAFKVLTAFDANITEKTDVLLKAERNRHIGVFVGSGGEELAVNVLKIDASKTFITSTTKTGFVGGAGQKAWSCDIIDKMVEMAIK